MKIVWTTVAVAVVGFGIPAYAAISSPTSQPKIGPAPAISVRSSPETTPSSVSAVVSTPASLPRINVPVVATTNSTAATAATAESQDGL